MVYACAASLSSVQGVVFQSASGPLALRGTVTTVSADNLGSHALGGFKEGGRALRCCRHCMVPSDDMGSKVRLCVYQSQLSLCLPVYIYYIPMSLLLPHVAHGRPSCPAYT